MSSISIVGSSNVFIFDNWSSEFMSISESLDKSCDLMNLNLILNLKKLELELKLMKDEYGF